MYQKYRQKSNHYEDRVSNIKDNAIVGDQLIRDPLKTTKAHENGSNRC